MESELQQIAAQREKLGDTLSTQEVLAQQVRNRRNGRVGEPISLRELIKIRWGYGADISISVYTYIYIYIHMLI